MESALWVSGQHALVLAVDLDREMHARQIGGLDGSRRCVAPVQSKVALNFLRKSCGSSCRRHPRYRITDALLDEIDAARPGRPA